MDPSTPFKRLGPVSRLREFVTPVEDVHVLAHLGVARVDPRQWRLRIDGMVERPFVLDLEEELLELPARELTAVFECYGNPLRPDDSSGMPPRQEPTRFAPALPTSGVGCSQLPAATQSTASS